jgi:hypothetical protein
VTSLEAALRQIHADLTEEHVSFALVGGLAVSARTEPRFTRDADLAVALASDAEAEALIRELRAHGYRIEAVVEQDAVGRLATVRLTRSSEPRGPGDGVSTIITCRTLVGPTYPRRRYCGRTPHVCCPNCEKSRRSRRASWPPLPSPGTRTRSPVRCPTGGSSVLGSSRRVAALEGLVQFSSFDPRRIGAALRRRLDDWRGLLRRQTRLARQVITRLLDGCIAWTPRRDKGSTFAGTIKFEKLLSGLVVTRGGTSSTGIDPFPSLLPSFDGPGKLGICTGRRCDRRPPA